MPSKSKILTTPVFRKTQAMWAIVWYTNMPKFCSGASGFELVDLPMFSCALQPTCYRAPQTLTHTHARTHQTSQMRMFYHVQAAIAMICVTKSRTGNYDFRACARARDFPGSTRFGRTHTLRRVCRAITQLAFLRKFHPDKIWNTLITITYLNR